MDLQPNDEQRLIQEMTRGLLAEHCPRAIVRKMENDPKGVPPALWKQMAEAGLTVYELAPRRVKQAIVGYATEKGTNVNLTQLKPIGAGISEPVVSKPTSMEEAKQNMRVEFRIVKVNPEELKASDFDF